jgi:hypothetical protein
MKRKQFHSQRRGVFMVPVLGIEGEPKGATVRCPEDEVKNIICEGTMAAD